MSVSLRTRGPKEMNGVGPDVRRAASLTSRTDTGRFRRKDLNAGFPEDLRATRGRGEGGGGERENRNKSVSAESESI